MGGLLNKPVNLADVYTLRVMTSDGMSRLGAHPGSGPGGPPVPWRRAAGPSMAGACSWRTPGTGNSECPPEQNMVDDSDLNLQSTLLKEKWDIFKMSIDTCDYTLTLSLQTLNPTLH